MAARKGWQDGCSSKVRVILKLVRQDGAASNKIVGLGGVLPLRFNIVHKILQSLFKLDYLRPDDGGECPQFPGGVPLLRNESYLVHNTLEQGSAQLIVGDSLEIESERRSSTSQVGGTW